MAYQKSEVPVECQSMKKVSGKILYISLLLVCLAVCFNVYTSFSFRSDSKKRNSIVRPGGRTFEDPYKNKLPLKWLKASFHNHTNEVWYTPGRNSVEEIQNAYVKHGYKILSFSDYERITLPKNPKIALLPGFEWGTNLRKRHLLVLGPKKAESDPFPFYASISNIQWIIDRFSDEGSFVTINHPKLNFSFSDEMLKDLNRYDALEIFSPFGDHLELWDKILSEKKYPFCMASDDLHYLPKDEYENAKANSYFTMRDAVSLLYQPEGQSLTRYVLLNTENLEIRNVLDSLKSGNYVCVKKYDRVLKDPRLVDLGVDDKDRVYFEFGENAMHVQLIGKNGIVLKDLFNVKKGFFKIPFQEPHVRIQIFFPTALVVSNTFYKKRTSSK
ncbi:phosphoesterase [Leptospira sp. 201903071]|uniref:phosphoesterase n=1 Tax=Leptospira ainazelensis TaxID=2810034 RepID=UPI00196504A2|nr:phosphoesterase [Leptospira ainazelensis]MBM9502474.1 phosphoesterase [Leptospira ainazelensis]